MLTHPLLLLGDQGLEFIKGGIDNPADVEPEALQKHADTLIMTISKKKLPHDNEDKHNRKGPIPSSMYAELDRVDTSSFMYVWIRNKR